MRPPPMALAALALAASQASNALGAAWSKSLFATIGVEGLIALRLGFAALLLGLLTRAWRLRVPRGQVGNMLAYGVAMGLMNSIAYQAYARIPLGIGLAIEVTGPLALVLLASRRRSDLAWVACTVAGLALILFKEAALPAIDPIGIALAFASAAIWAGYIVVGKRVALLGSGSVVAAGLAVASTFLVPIGVATAGSALLDGRMILWGVTIAVLSSAFPFFLQILALRRLPASLYGLIASASPAVGALMAFLVLGEPLAARQWLGIALVIAASAGAVLTARR